MVLSTELSVGFIGLGNMGGPMSRNIVDTGFPTKAADLDPAKVAALVEGGAVGAADAVDAATDVDIVLTSLPGPAQVRGIGEAILPVMKAGSIWIDLSTNNLDCARHLDGLAEPTGVSLLDAPVTGGVEGAEAGTLWVLVGGDETTHTRAEPVLAAIGSRYDLLGGRGAGYVSKIASVSLCYLQSVCLTEALLLGVKGGADPAKMLEVIRNSTGRSYVADRYGPEILSGGYDDTFDLELAAKDLRLATELAATVGADLPFTCEVTDFYADAVGAYGAHAPHLIAMQALERRNDLILHEMGNDT